ncbi:MAG TPA: hypothetical protein VF653_13270, partial [Methylomirabilota bacterium]
MNLAAPEIQREALDALKPDLWRRGLFRYLTLPNAQRRMYERAHEQVARFPGVPEPLILLCHRQLGKSHLAVTLGMERNV